MLSSRGQSLMTSQRSDSLSWHNAHRHTGAGIFDCWRIFGKQVNPARIEAQLVHVFGLYAAIIHRQSRGLVKRRATADFGSENNERRIAAPGRGIIRYVVIRNTSRLARAELIDIDIATACNAGLVSDQ